MYTNDERFAILHTPGSNTWTLQIKFVQRRDHGMYECQVRMRMRMSVVKKKHWYLLPVSCTECNFYVGYKSDISVGYIVTLYHSSMNMDL